ncbi:PREDICTED: plakophilin-3 [Ficedula albicollis]|uniref:plakophilin-3 n=1 Tax=Ficedula albicollis TaxID=59894 RepID=UPI0007AD8E1D|nr:PREDICTED: plakophilin-3 [Ficedula albicollis]
MCLQQTATAGGFSATHVPSTNSHSWGLFVTNSLCLSSIFSFWYPQTLPIAPLRGAPVSPEIAALAGRRAGSMQNPGEETGWASPTPAADAGAHPRPAAPKGAPARPRMLQDSGPPGPPTQPEAGVCSLALPSDRQLDERGREAAEAQRLRSARVQEQVRIRMMLRGQAPARPDDLADGTRGGQYSSTLRSSFSSRSQSNGVDPKASVPPPSRTIRAPAMRTLQRFQSNNRSRLSTGSFGTVPAGGSGAFLGLGEHSSRAPSVRSLAESGHHLAEPRAMEMYNGHSTLLGHHAGGFDDIDLPSAVKYLIASDPNLQVLGAAYLQHKCYSDSSAKKQARSLQAMPKLVKLFNSPNQEVQRHATGAMRNLIYDNAENKLALVEENGIYELMRTLREPDDELRKNVTGILWNLSSSDNLKDRLARDTLEQLTDLVLVPLSGLGGSGVIQQNPSEAEIFYNSTGFLRNLSSASQQTRQKMRECHGLVDSMIHYVNSSLEVGKSEDKSVENAVCVLRNLSYRLYDEMPPSSLQRLEGHRRNAGGTVTGELVGCFSPQSKKAREHYLNADIVTFTEVSKDPKGMEWLWNPQIVGIYNRLLQRCELNKHTTEAASGALQNITAGDRRWAGVLSRLALEQERILNPVLDRVRTADHHQLRSLTGLIRNLSRHARNKDEMSTKVVSHLIEKLPGSVGDKAPPADVIVNIIAVLNNLVVESPMAARDIVYFDGLRKLFFIKKRRDSSDNEKSSRAAASLLGNMWQYTKLHRDFKMKGYRKEDFLSL